jgi:2-desacetyl-2-hydroxyethyl bacteriochlorophyllide A dehydrogenase
MKALVIEKPGKALTRDVTMPAPGPHDVLIEVAACGICGTDVHIYRGEYLGSYPITPGHEFAGTVTAVGAAVRRFKPGDRVAVEPNIACNNCPACLSNRQNFCENWQGVGVTLPGGFADVVSVPENAVFSIGALPFFAGAFVEPLSCVLHGVQKLDPSPADRILIVGAGPIGNLIMKTTISLGASSLTLVDRSESRLALAAAEGGSVVTTLASVDELPTDAYDVVIDATGVPALMERSTAWVRPGGRILLFGVPPTGARISIDAFSVFRKGLTVLSSYTSVRNSLQAIRMLESGRIDVKRLVSHELPLTDFARGVELIEKGAQGVLKIMLIPSR